MRDRFESNERGATAVLVAGAMLFLFGAAALAVDVSVFQSSARTTQNTADFSCLAGVVEDTDLDKMTMAADFTRQNWPEMAAGGVYTQLTASSATLASGTHQVLYETSVGGDPDVMRVRVLEAKDANFARALGAGTVDVVQDAYCEQAEIGGGGVLPFGAVTGGWTGPLQINPPCGNGGGGNGNGNGNGNGGGNGNGNGNGGGNNGDDGTSAGNCGALSIKRDDVSGAGNTLIKNIAEGSDRLLSAWLGNYQPNTTHCDDVSAGDTCHRVDTDPGVSAAHLGQGFFDRFRIDNNPGATCTYQQGGAVLDCDSPSQVLGGSWTEVTSLDADDWEDIYEGHPTWDGWNSDTPPFWNTQLYGTYNGTNAAQHYFYNGVVEKCDSPRLASVPIVSPNLDWNYGDSHEGWGNGATELKIVGFVDVIVEEPYDSGDWVGQSNLHTAGASVIWFGPDATCGDEDGPKIGMLNNAPLFQGADWVKLVAG